MTHVLVINSSLDTSGSLSRAMVDGYLRTHQALEKAASFTVRDFAAAPLPQMSAGVLPMYLGKPELADPEARAFCDDLIREIEQSDVIALGLPTYNFMIPASVKLWLDYIVCAGRTFKYTPNGPQGLLPHGKKVIAFIASGGVYSEGEGEKLDYVLPYLKTIFGLIGIIDIQAVRAEGVAFGDVQAIRATAVAKAVAVARGIAAAG